MSRITLQDVLRSRNIHVYCANCKQVSNWRVFKRKGKAVRWQCGNCLHIDPWRKG